MERYNLSFETSWKTIESNDRHEFVHSTCRKSKFLISNVVEKSHSSIADTSISKTRVISMFDSFLRSIFIKSPFCTVAKFEGTVVPKISLCRQAILKESKITVHEQSST